jgi:hypothetical protein
LCLIAKRLLALEREGSRALGSLEVNFAVVGYVNLAYVSLAAVEGNVDLGRVTVVLAGAVYAIRSIGILQGESAANGEAAVVESQVSITIAEYAYESALTERLVAVGRHGDRDEYGRETAAAAARHAPAAGTSPTAVMSPAWAKARTRAGTPARVSTPTRTVVSAAPTGTAVTGTTGTVARIVPAGIAAVARVVPTRVAAVSRVVPARISTVAGARTRTTGAVSWIIPSRVAAGAARASVTRTAGAAKAWAAVTGTAATKVSVGSHGRGGDDKSEKQGDVFHYGFSLAGLLPGAA